MTTNITIPRALLAQQGEPVAWRTFDGEGGYYYRSYDDNENYAEEWAKRNPRHIGWVEPLYTAVPAAQPDQRFTDLLCRIHRDGGHYIAEHGFDKAVLDADTKVAQLNAISDAPPAQPTCKQDLQVETSQDRLVRMCPDIGCGRKKSCTRVVGISCISRADFAPSATRSET